MAKKKSENQRTDAQGNLHKTFADGRCEIYIGGFDKDKQYAEITDAADEAVNRKRFLPYIGPAVEDTLQNRGKPEIATREADEIDE